MLNPQHLVLSELRRRASDYRTQVEAAAAFGYSTAFFNMMLTGRKSIPKNLCEQLGFCAAWVPAPIRRGREVNNKRFQLVLNGQTATAQKIFEHVPISDEWDLGQIIVSVRHNGLNVGQDVIEACLKQLVEAGLVVRTANKFCRVKVRERVARRVDTTEYADSKKPAAPVPVAQASKRTVLDIMSSIAERAKGLAKGLQELAEDIEDAALEIESQDSEIKEQAEQLMQLKKLLKGLGI